MDSFVALNISSNPADIQPVSQEVEGDNVTSYCVVFARQDIPSNEEVEGNDVTSYCVVA
ncbi:hypothetical protein H2248_010989 [Termitomyces sp. 'cryptogamus']|nr:hypothetical protein H2248_010989 [Termitomyces sp. 'cryptogamus']